MRSDGTAFQDGFKMRKSELAVPSDTTDLDPQTKRALTICNLFINHKLTIADIIRVLDEDYGDVIMALLENGVVQDRRLRQGRAPHNLERRSQGNA